MKTSLIGLSVLLEYIDLLTLLISLRLTCDQTGKTASMQYAVCCMLIKLFRHDYYLLHVQL